MATRTITRLYDNHDDAVQVMQNLEQAGVPHDDISLVANNSDQRYGSGSGTGTATGLTSGDPEQGASTGAGTGASLGTLLGGGAGLLAGIGALAIPGVGPIVAAGWLVATLTGAGVGAAAGGLVGSLTGAGVSEADAEMHAEGVRRGGSLITVRTDEALASKVEGILDSRGAVNLASRRTEYQAEGWSRYDPAAADYTSDQVLAERGRRTPTT
jgi:hypothetical protein